MFLSKKNNWKSFLQYALLNVFVNYGAMKNSETLWADKSFLSCVNSPMHFM